MSEEKKTFEYIPENYEEEMLKRKQKARMRKEKDAESFDLNVSSLMDILTIMLVFLLKSYATDPVNITPGPELEIPRTTSLLKPSATVTITVSKSSIVVDNKPVLIVKDGKVEASQKRGGEDGYFIIPLNKVLVTAAENKRKLAAYNPTVKFEGIATIVMDQDTPYRLLTEIMYTAGQAEFNKFKFAAIAGAPSKG